MQQAIPCICTKEETIPDIIEDGKTGLIDKKEAKVLAERILEPANDKEKRLNMGQNGYWQFKQKYTFQEKRLCDGFENNMQLETSLMQRLPSRL